MARQRLQERFILNKEVAKKIPITESLEIVEKDGRKLKCRAAYEIPTWKLDKKNLNGRTYSTPLAEKVIQESQSTLGLANHPDNEADVTMTFAVEKNPHIKEGVMYVDAYFVGQHGELAKEIIEAGGEIGLSSSALGDVDDAGNVVLEGFEVERFADWVDSPSYQVFVGQNGSLEAKSTKESEGINENTTNTIGHIKVNKELEFISTNTIMEKKEIGNMPNKTNDKTLTIEEKNLRLGVKGLLEKAESKTNLKEKVTAYQEVVEYCEGVDFASKYVTEATSKITDLEKQLYELADKGKELDQIVETSNKTVTELQKELTEIKESQETIAEKYERAIELLENMRDRENKLKELYQVALAEKNGMIEPSEYKELQVFTETKEEEVDNLKEEINKLKKRLRTIMEAGLKSSKKLPEEEDKKDKKDKDDEEEMEPEEEKGDVKDEKKKDESDFNFRNTSQVERYYEDLYDANSSVEKIQEDILGCKTLLEAQKKYLNLKDLVEEDILPPSFRDVPVIEESVSRKRKLTIKKGWV